MLTEFSVISALVISPPLVEPPITGRTHQISLSMPHAGHPIAGDPKYGDDDFSRRFVSWVASACFCPRSLTTELPTVPAGRCCRAG